METQVASQWVGIDVSKAKLDIALRPANKVLQFCSFASNQSRVRLAGIKRTTQKIQN